jgi:hypothetical protein
MTVWISTTAGPTGPGRNGRSGGVAYAVQTAVNGGSELLIFVRRVLSISSRASAFPTSCRRVNFPLWSVTVPVPLGPARPLPALAARRNAYRRRPRRRRGAHRGAWAAPVHRGWASRRRGPALHHTCGHHWPAAPPPDLAGASERCIDPSHRRRPTHTARTMALPDSAARTELGSSQDRSPRPSLTRFAGWSSPDGSRLVARHDSDWPKPAPRHHHGITSNAGSAQAAPCGSTSADQVVKMSSGRNADTRKLGTSTSWLTLRSTATLQMAYAC